MDDVFQDVRERERQSIDKMRVDIDKIERVENLAKRASALRHSPGYEDFVKSVRGVHEHVVRQLVVEDLTNDRVRELRGKAQALSDVLALLERSDRSLEALAVQREFLQNALNEAMKRRPQTQPAEVS